MLKVFIVWGMGAVLEQTNISEVFQIVSKVDYKH